MALASDSAELTREKRCTSSFRFLTDDRVPSALSANSTRRAGQLKNRNITRSQRRYSISNLPCDTKAHIARLVEGGNLAELWRQTDAETHSTIRVRPSFGAVQSNTTPTSRVIRGSTGARRREVGATRARAAFLFLFEPDSGCRLLVFSKLK